MFHFFETEGYSIYVRNLPQNATAAQLQEVFKMFGPIKQGGVQVRSNKVAFYCSFVNSLTCSKNHSCSCAADGMCLCFFLPSSKDSALVL